MQPGEPLPLAAWLSFFMHNWCTLNLGKENLHHPEVDTTTKVYTRVHTTSSEYYSPSSIYAGHGTEDLATARPWCYRTYQHSNFPEPYIPETEVIGRVETYF